MFRVVEVVEDRGTEQFRGLVDIRDDEAAAARLAARKARRPGHATAVIAFAWVDAAGREVGRAPVVVTGRS